MTESADLRSTVLGRLRDDLMGPAGADDEVIEERPSDRYLTGILYPRQSTADQEGDDALGTANGDKDSNSDDEQVAGMRLARPAAAGISFAVSGTSPIVQFRVRCGIYSQESEDKPSEDAGKKRGQKWRRKQVDLTAIHSVSKAGSVDLGATAPQGLELALQCTSSDGYTLVTAALVNRILIPKESSRLASDAKCFYQVQLEATAGPGTTIVARPSRKAALDDDGLSGALLYRDAREFAVGHTCSAEWTTADDGHSATRVSTSWFPEAAVQAVSGYGGEVFRALARSKQGACFKAQTIATAQGDLRSLFEPFLLAYHSWIEEQEARIPHLAAHLQSQGRGHIRTCRETLGRMKAGVELLHNDANARTAFQLANRAMQLQYSWVNGAGSQLTWRPFQMGFLLLSIASVHARGHEDRALMDLLWFPTGGGKTEAYLGLIAFTLFSRRLQYAEDPDRGAGTSAIMRYTLRLLTTQQFQRAAALVLGCESIRRELSGGGPKLGDTPFSIGLWVGGDAVANTVREALTALGGGPGGRPDQLTQCPACRNRLLWQADPKRHYIQVRCETSGCVLTGFDLPIWTVDDTVYERCPSLLIGTVDKFAILPLRPEAGRLFGIGTSHDAPDLIIQDELHLISGPLGTIAGLYEGAIDELCTRGRIRPKIIGSTATIRRAEEQIKALFARTGKLFPPPGLDAGDSCFAVIDRDRPARRYAAISTAGRSAKYILQAVAASLAQSAEYLRESGMAVDGYWTIVEYFNALRELGGAVVLMQDDVPASVAQYAHRRAETPRELQNIAELTSRLSQAELKDKLAELEVPVGKEGSIDAVLATNMISVGIDIGRLGLMIMNGQPKTVAEYIQATSRVGRQQYPGLVIAIYNNAKARDRSRFETFRTWHDTLYREVEATSVTPFSSRARDRALRATLVTIARHMIVPLRDEPTLGAHKNELWDRLQVLVERARTVDPEEADATYDELERAVLEWESRGILKKYMAYPQTKAPAVMMSAEHAATLRAARRDVGDAWPVPTSMRNVEPGTPVTLVEALAAPREDQ